MHVEELEKCLSCLGCWGELGKVLLLEMRDLGPPSSLPGGQAPLYLSTWFLSWGKPPD